MVQWPIAFCPLFHDIIPCENFPLLKTGKEVERRTGKFEKLWLFLGIIIPYSFYYTLTERRLCSFMRLIDNDEIPIKQENIIVFIKLSADSFRAAQILNRGKIYKGNIGIDKIFDFFTLCF